MDSLSRAKKNIQAHAGTDADEALAYLAEGDGGPASVSDDQMLRLLAPDGPIFRAAKLLTADKSLRKVTASLAAEALGGEQLWQRRREVRVLASTRPAAAEDEIATMLGLLDRLIGLASAWEATVQVEGTTGAAKQHSTGKAGVAAAGLFLERLGTPSRDLIAALLDGLPLVLGFLRDRRFAEAIATRPAPVAEHLCALHESLWELIEHHARNEPPSYERAKELDHAIEAVFVRIRKEGNAAAKMAAAAALYRLLLCIWGAAARDRIRVSLEELRARFRGRTQRPDPL